MLAWLFLHFVIGMAGTWIARKYAIRRKLIDQPGERRSHAVPTPRGGGIAIVLSLLVAACVLGLRNPQEIVLVGGFVLGLVLVAGVGMIDDHRPLSPWLRLGVQGIAAANFALAVAGRWGDLQVALLAFLAVMVLTNVWNFMDGINGIATTQATLLAGGLVLLAGGSWAWVALALVGACLGFLPFNFPKARIFLGDVGSGALGYAMAALLVIASVNGSLPAPLLLLPAGAFLVDSGLTLLRRVLRGERWWTSHAQHAYQRWAAASGAHTTVTLAYAGWTAASWLLAFWLAPKAEGQMIAGCAIWFTMAVAIWALLQRACAVEGPRMAAVEKDGK